MIHLQRRCAQLAATIARLKSLMGENLEQELNMTDVIRRILAARKGFVGVAQIVLNLRVQGFSGAKEASVVTILNRLARNNEIEQGKRLRRWPRFG